MELTTEQKQELENWLSERPENVRNVAESIVPWKRYHDKRIADDIGNLYYPRSYDEQEDGTVTITCEKSNDQMAILGRYGVFGMNPDDLVEAD